MSRQDLQFMQQALKLGRYGLGRTAPNPAVGCVLVDTAGRVVGTGYTQAGGRPHAEAIALQKAGDAARGGTAYVTLEPCAHEGQTGPCAEALIAAGVSRVVFALQDPDPRVDGGGADKLRAAGIAVEQGLCADVAQADQLGFLLKTVKGRPMVTLKLALSANGFMRTPDGESPWITGPQARSMGHYLRATHDAIITGSGTLQADDPSLDCRLPGLADASPLPMVMRRSGDLPSDRKLAQRDGVLVSNAAPLAVLQDLATRGVTRVLLECGPVLAKAFFQEDLVDALAIFSAPHDIDLSGESDISRMGLALDRFALTAEQTLGTDVYRHYRHKEERL